MRVRFGEFVLDPDERLLWQGGVERALEPKIFDCLALLVSRAGKLTSLEQLRARLWPNVRVPDGALRRVINETRRVLGDTGAAQAAIRTRKGVGYVFVAPVHADSPAQLTAEAPKPQSWPFVGRGRELARLGSWLEDTSAGGMCLLSGEAGSGKSSLLARLAADDPHLAQARWLTGHCRATLGMPAYWPFREICAQLMRVPALRTRVHALTQRSRHVLRGLPELVGDDAIDHGSDAQAQFELCEAFGALLAQLSELAPLRLVVDDVHWADAGSIALLDAVARAARGRPLHVFASYRPEAVEPGKALGHFLGRTSGREGVLSLHLDALGVDDVRLLLNSLRIPGSAGAAPQLLHRLTGGNALFLGELVRHALALELPLDAALPPSIAHIVEQRTRVLPERTQRLLGRAAVLGHDFRLDVLSALAGGPPLQALLDELEPARRAGVLSRDADDPERWFFSHALVGDALVAGLSSAERAGYHGDALRAWQTLRGPAAPSGVLAQHAFEAGVQLPRDERRMLCEQAGRQAFEAQVFDRAVLHLGRAIALLDAGDCSREAAELSLLWAKARWHADDADGEVARAFLQAAEHARRSQLPDLLAQAAIGYALGDESSVHLRSVALRPEALELLEEAWASLVAADSCGAGLRGEIPYRLAAALCWIRCEAGALEDFQNAARLALRLAPPAPDAFRKLWLLALEGAADAARSEDVHAAVVQLLQSAALTPVQRLDGWAISMGARLVQGDRRGYERAVREVAQLAELLPQPARIGRHGARLSAYSAVPRCARVTLAVMEGRLTEAERAFAEVGEHSMRLGLALTPEQADHIFCMLLWLYGYQGRTSQLEPLIDRHLETNPDAHWFGALTKAQFALERGELGLARSHFRVLQESRFRPQLRGKPLLAKPETLVRAADVCRAIGEVEDAAILYEALLPRAELCIQDGALICFGACARPLAELALVLGLHARAEAHFRTALEQNTRLGHAPELVRTRLGLGRALLDAGRSEEARSLIAAARAAAQTMGMVRDVAHADMLAARAGSTVATETASG